MGERKQIPRSAEPSGAQKARFSRDDRAETTNHRRRNDIFSGEAREGLRGRAGIGWLVLAADGEFQQLSRGLRTKSDVGKLCPFAFIVYAQGGTGADISESEAPGQFPALL